MLVDAGWLFAAGSTSAFGERVSRRELVWDPASLIESLMARARSLVASDTELLRVYWYDGSPNRLPVGQQHQVANLQDVKLRLGRTARDGQKGVDGMIIHDLITLAYRQTIEEAVVISGDEDLLDAIESAQSYGTRVHLLEIPIGGIADALLRSVDRRDTLDESFWRGHLGRREPEQAPMPVAPVPAAEAALVTRSPAGLAAEAASPAVQDRPSALSAPPRPGFGDSDLAPRGSVGPPRHLGSGSAGLLGSPTAPSVRPPWMDAPLPFRPPPDAELVQESAQRIGEVVEAGARFAERWAVAADPDSFAELLAARPYLPGELDAELLRRASPNGVWLNESQRRALRDSFWSTLVSQPRPDRT